MLSWMLAQQVLVVWRRYGRRVVVKRVFYLSEVLCQLLLLAVGRRYGRRVVLMRVFSLSKVLCQLLLLAVMMEHWGHPYRSASASVVQDIRVLRQL